MEDFIFGTLATDELKLHYHRASRAGLQHGSRLEPTDPVPDRPVSILVTTAPDFPVETVVCYYTLDGSEPTGSKGRVTNGSILQLQPTDAIWDTFLWGYCGRWRGQLPAQPAGTLVRYRIGAWRNGGSETFADWPDVKATTDRAAEAFFHRKPLDGTWVGDPQAGSTFSYAVDRLGPPEWAREAVFYQVFVDRFFPGQGREWLQSSDLHGFFGGTLWGVSEKLDYLAELGASAIWLSPIFPSPTTHGYDATDYRTVEPRLGGEQALRELVAAAHGRGIRIILDLVCNHVSDRHPIFLEALANSRSPYREWFSFDDSDVGYRSFFGVRSMPQLNLANPEARAWMTDIARYWLREFEVDGYRLDHANGPGPSYWSEFWAACKAEKTDCFCFGEIVEPVDVVRRYAGRLDGSLDFILADWMRRTFGDRQLPLASFDQFLRQHLSQFDSDFLTLTFIDNHDMDRFLYLAGGDKRILRQVVALQMQLPGPPIIYYGTEVGMSQVVGKASRTGLEASRAAMQWDGQQDRELLESYRNLIRARMEAKPWAAGGSAPIQVIAALDPSGA